MYQTISFRLNPNHSPKPSISYITYALHTSPTSLRTLLCLAHYSAATRASFLIFNSTKSFPFQAFPYATPHALNAPFPRSFLGWCIFPSGKTSHSHRGIPWPPPGLYHLFNYFFVSCSSNYHGLLLRL